MSPGHQPLRQVDVHTHAMPLPLLEWLADAGLADLSGLPDGRILIDPSVSGMPGDTVLTCPPEMYDVSARLAAMADVGVEVHAVSLSPYLLGAVSRDSVAVLDLVRRGNDALARFVAQAPDQLVALGAVPIGHAGLVGEAERCLDLLGMRGLMIGTHGAGHELAEPRHDPLWELLAARAVFTFLHPVAGPGGEGEPGVPWAASVAASADLALAVSGLVRAGVLERWDFPLCLAYGGGAVPGVRGALQRGWERVSEAPDVHTAPLDQLRRLYYDSATFDVQQLRQLVEFVGPAHVLMGSDYPSKSGDTDPIGVVQECQLGPVQEMITGVNAAALLELAL